MPNHLPVLSPSRRSFLCSASCFGCGALFAGQAPSAPRFKKPCGLNYEQAFDFAVAQQLLPNLEPLMQALGRDKALAILRQDYSRRIQAAAAEAAKQAGKNDLPTAIHYIMKPDAFWIDTAHWEFIHNTPTEVELKVTECVWVKPFRDAKAADLGHTIVCAFDEEWARGFNPKIKFTRTKTLMQGDAFCNHHWQA